MSYSGSGCYSRRFLHGSVANILGGDRRGAANHYPVDRDASPRRPAHAFLLGPRLLRRTALYFALLCCLLCALCILSFAELQHVSGIGEVVICTRFCLHGRTPYMTQCILRGSWSMTKLALDCRCILLRTSLIWNGDLNMRHFRKTGTQGGLAGDVGI